MSDRRQSVLSLRAFYASALGEAVRRMIARKVAEAWADDGAGLDVLALGYATPFVGGWADRARRVVAAMPSAQGVEAWPVGADNRACLADEAALPLQNALFDRILLAHALEESDDALALLAEARRVLAPSGRMILVAAARRGLWAEAEGAPFGHGRPFSRRQLERLAEDAELTPVSWTRALYVPPVASAARFADGFERIGARLWPPFAGVILIEAVKQTFALQPRAERVRIPAGRRGLLAPAPVGQ
ncbi:MAG: methyltransferase domain-containing protein [Caulobacteraceae bacterium]|nr:methyltransferase domain-containing protein [Caulobacteraceae bacterium]